MTSAAKDGVNGFSQWRLAAEDSQGCRGFPAQSTWRAMTALEITIRGKKEKLEYRNCQQQRRSHHASYSWEEQCRAGSHLQIGNDLANHCWLIISKAFQDRSWNDRQRVDLADDVCRFSSELTVLGIIHLWETSDIQKRLEDNQERLVTP